MQCPLCDGEEPDEYKLLCHLYFDHLRNPKKWEVTRFCWCGMCLMGPSEFSAHCALHDGIMAHYLASKLGVD